ncbi:hypothetical protein Salat_0601200 [Sesamum alatum]|uniref:CCHC-type domain-containing protein n=1 Tax=Sesamum alatum TaxID=300844 RepID=A0AAE1YPV4_9LAMI|nr:hypothetical protein Salat_0601200 [Sesamum alatum]
MGDLQVICGIKKLNNNNYNSWSTCIMSYMQGQDLWEVVNGNERDLTIAQYFHKVKSLCREISELDPEAPIGETRMKRIIIHGLKPEFRSFVAAVQGWPTQPSLVELENLLAGQEALAKQMGGASLKNDEEALYASKGRRNSKVSGFKKSDDKARSHQSEGSIRTAEGSKNHGNVKKFKGKCYKCGKKGHMMKDCWLKKSVVESNAATLKIKDEWDFEASFTADEDDLALATITSNQINYENDWIVDSGCSNYMTDNSKLSTTHVGNTVVSPQYNEAEDVKIYSNVEILSEPVMMGQRMESVYLMSAETAYVDKARRNETADLWHMRLSHVSYSKLDVMMRKSMLKGLPKLEVRRDTICAGCQYGYDSQRKGWPCCDPTIGKCYISRNVVFNEASSWWSLSQEILPDSGVFKEAVEDSQIKLILENIEAENGDQDVAVVQSPWQTGVYQRQEEEREPNEAEVETPLERSLGMVNGTEADVERKY